jgi:hypothetical protein
MQRGSYSVALRLLLECPATAPSYLLFLLLLRLGLLDTANNLDSTWKQALEAYQSDPGIRYDRLRACPNRLISDLDLEYSRLVQLAFRDDSAGAVSDLVEAVCARRDWTYSQYVIEGAMYYFDCAEQDRANSTLISLLRLVGPEPAVALDIVLRLGTQVPKGLGLDKAVTATCRNVLRSALRTSGVEYSLGVLDACDNSYSSACGHLLAAMEHEPANLLAWSDFQLFRNASDQHLSPVESMRLAWCRARSFFALIPLARRLSKLAASSYGPFSEDGA